MINSESEDWKERLNRKERLISKTYFKTNCVKVTLLTYFLLHNSFLNTLYMPNLEKTNDSGINFRKILITIEIARE